MDAKLTLNMNREIADKAKKYARSEGKSLSNLVEDYLRFLTGQMDSEEHQISPRVKSIQGSIVVPEGFDYKKELSGSLNDKNPDK